MCVGPSVCEKVKVRKKRRMNGIQATENGRITANRQMCEYCFDTLIKTLDDKGDEIAKPQITNDELYVCIAFVYFV